MRRIGQEVVRALAGLLVAAAAASPLGAAERNPVRALAAPASDEAQARVIVRFRLGAAALRAQAASVSTQAQLSGRATVMGERLGLSLKAGRAISERSQVLMASGLSSQALASRLLADGDVESAVPDRRRHASWVPNDPLYPAGQSESTPAVGQWYLRAPGVAASAAIHAEAAWDISRGSASIVVAVLDTGIRPEHPDLVGRTVPGYDFVSTDTGGLANTANDGNGRDADPSDPGDWITAAEDSLKGGFFEGCGAGNSSWHGTQTAGLIGASANNGVGMAGVAPQALLLPVRVLGKCGGYDSDIQAGMRWAAGLTVPGVPTNTHPARVMNLSLGGDGECSSDYQGVISELTALKVVVVSAAGNAGTAVESPGNCAGVIAVAGVRHAGTKVGYSSLGPEIAISAPAGNCVNTGASQPCLYPILTTVNAGTTTPGSSSYSDAYNVSLGTSFSTPLVAGTVALMLSVNPSLSVAQVRSALQASARPFPTTGSEASTPVCTAPGATAQDFECYCTTSTCGAGMLDARGAVAAVAAMVPQAAIVASNSTPTAGDTVNLTSTGSVASTGASISSYTWSILSGSDHARFSGATNGSSATLVSESAGTVTVQLRVEDSSGKSATTSSTLTISAAAGSGGGGGGAFSLWWGLALALWMLALPGRRVVRVARAVGRR